MHLKTTIFCVTFLFPLVFGLAKNSGTARSAKANNNDCDYKKADRCALEIIPITDEEFLANPPKNVADVTKWCKRYKSREECLKNYAEKCLKKETKQSLSVMLFAATKTTKRYCTNSKRKNTLFQIFQCMKLNLKTYNGIMNNITIDYHSLRDFKPANLRIPLACCSYYQRKDEAIQLLQKDCPDIIGEAENLLQSYISDISNLACGDYSEESDKCPKILSKLKRTNKPLEWSSFLIPLVEIFDNIE